MSNEFREFYLRDIFCYLDDILIYSISPEEHVVLVRKVCGKESFIKLISLGLQLNANKEEI